MTSMSTSSQNTTSSSSMPFNSTTASSTSSSASSSASASASASGSTSTSASASASASASSSQAAASSSSSAASSSSSAASSSSTTSAAASCPTTQVTCAGSCTDLTSDPSNCGACGTVCASGDICTGSSCQPCDGTTASQNPFTNTCDCNQGYSAVGRPNNLSCAPMPQCDGVTAVYNSATNMCDCNTGYVPNTATTCTFQNDPCPTVANPYLVDGKDYNIDCNGFYSTAYGAQPISRITVTNMGACVSSCATTTGCISVSYNPTSGDCFLLSNLGTGPLASGQGYDSATLAGTPLP